MRPIRNNDIEPCRHMQRWVNGLADGSLDGLARWYTRLHVRDCPRCRAALQALKELRERLRTLGAAVAEQAASTLTPTRMLAVEAALDDVDRRCGGP